MIGSICVSSKATYFDSLPNEILEHVMYYLGEEDLNNLTSEKFVSERIKASAIKALMIFIGKYFNKTILSLKSRL